MTAPADPRAFVLSRPSVGPSDLQREFRGLTYNAACRELENLEAQRLIGYQVINGLPRWSPAFQVDEERVRQLRELFGMAPRLVAEKAGHIMTTKRKYARKLLRHHVEERHPGTLARCGRCR